MSIDRDTFEAPCMCGKGKLFTTYESNDWGPVGEHDRLDCEDCKAKYERVWLNAGSNRAGYGWRLKDPK